MTRLRGPDKKPSGPHAADFGIRTPDAKLLSGGGLQMGKVVGQSTRDGSEPLTEPVTMKHLLATIMHTAFDVGQLRLDRTLPTDLLRLVTEGEPMRELL